MEKPKQTQAVIDVIFSDIDDGRLLPGKQLDEKELMARCSVSRTPVREAFIQLEADGLIERHTRKGVRLFKPSTEEFLAILEVHANLEAQAAELATQRISEELRIELAELVDACQACAARPESQDHVGYYALNLRFHEIIAEATCNPFLIDMIKLNARKLMAHYRLRYRISGAIRESAQEHATIAKHILGQQKSKARAAMIAHFDYDRATVMNMIASVS